MMKMVTMARFGAEDTRRTIDSAHRTTAESKALLERYPSHQHILHLPAVEAVLPPPDAPQKIWRCLVKIKYADILDLRIVDCTECIHGIYLDIPVADYDPDVAHLRPEWTLRVPSPWLAQCAAPEYELLCRRMIDLDERDELPWEDLPPLPAE
jgi:hypothetical protein